MIELFNKYGWAFFAYLVLVAFFGVRLLKDEKVMMFGRMAQTLQAGQAPMKALMSSFKNMVAGVLLVIPGVITDAVAVVLLLMPSVKVAQNPSQATGGASDNTRAGARAGARTSAANDDIIEGEFTREDEPK